MHFFILAKRMQMPIAKSKPNKPLWPFCTTLFSSFQVPSGACAGPEALLSKIKRAPVVSFSFKRGPDHVRSRGLASPAVRIEVKRPILFRDTQQNLCFDCH